MPAPRIGSRSPAYNRTVRAPAVRPTAEVTVSRIAFLAAVLTLGCATVPAAEPPRLPPPEPKARAKDDPVPAKPEAKTDAAEAEAVAKLLRDLVKKNLPDPLTKSDKEWGKQVAVVVRHREGFRMWSAPVQEMVNDGLWRRFDVRIPDPDTITLDVTELTHPEKDKINITVKATCERVDLHLEHQLWRNGRRLYGGETRAHCKAGIVIKAEVETKTEFKNGGLVPDLTIKFKATDAELSYDELVIDKAAGFDGPVMKALAEQVVQTVKTVKPDLEKDLLEKANAAILKAAGTREFKVAMGKVTEIKPKK